MMRLQRLDSVTRITMGQAPAGESYNSVSNGLPLIAGAGDFGSHCPVPKKFTSAPGKVCLMGDIILGIRASIGAKVLADGTYCLGRGVAGIRATPEIDNRYLWHCLTYVTPQLTAKAKGATFKQVNREDIGELPIPLPPLPEQRRTASILDAADALRAKRRVAIQKLDELTQSIFLDMFGDPTRNPKGWPLAKLCAVTAAINDCPHSTPKWTEKGHICLRTSNLTVGGWDWNDTRYVSGADYAERSRRGEICPGDIILSREGTVGIGAIVQPAMHVCMGQRLVHLRPNERMNSEFLLRHLLHILAPIRIGKSMVGSTSRHLNVKELRNLKVPVPPVDIQHGFAQAIREIRYLTQLQLKAIGCLNALFASLQHLAFRGELWADFDEESEDAHAFRR